MSTTNIKQVNLGQQITFSISLNAVFGGPLVDADLLPTYQIFDPNNVMLTSGNSVHISTGVYEAYYVVDTQAPFSNFYKIVWNASVGGNADPNLWEYFQVVPVTPTYANIVISQDWLEQIKKVLAFPKVPNILLSDDEIRKFAVFPAMTQYFVKFPLKSVYSVFSSDLIVVPFPDIDTFGLLDCRVVDIGSIGGTGSSFWDILAYQRMGVLGNTIVYGRRGLNPNGLYQQRLQLQQAMKSQQNLLATIKFNVDYIARNVEVYASTTGKVNLTWAKTSNNFENVIFQRKFDVVQLAQANLLDHLADTFDIISDNSLDININVEAIRTRATDLRTKIEDKWIEFSPIILLKNV